MHLAPGGIGTAGFALESVAARVCREAGAPESPRTVANQMAIEVEKATAPFQYALSTKESRATQFTAAFASFGRD